MSRAQDACGFLRASPVCRPRPLNIKTLPKPSLTSSRRTPKLDTLCLTCSCARGKASRDSCLDMLVLGRTRTANLEKAWEEFYATAPVFQELAAVGKYAHVDLEFSDGHFAPTPRGWTGGPDEFELVIGRNYLVYSVVLHQNGDYFDALREKWLPYYDEQLRQQRLAIARD